MTPKARDLFFSAFRGNRMNVPGWLRLVKYVRAIAANPRVLTAGAAWARRFVRRAGGWRALRRRVRPVTFVMHSFIDARDVAPAWALLQQGETSAEPRIHAAQERLRACVYTMGHPETGELVPACVQHSVLDPGENRQFVEISPSVVTEPATPCSIAVCARSRTVWSNRQPGAWPATPPRTRPRSSHSSSPWRAALAASDLPGTGAGGLAASDAPRRTRRPGGPAAGRGLGCRRLPRHHRRHRRLRRGAPRRRPRRRRPKRLDRGGVPAGQLLREHDLVDLSVRAAREARHGRRRDGREDIDHHATPRSWRAPRPSSSTASSWRFRASPPGCSGPWRPRSGST